MQLVQHWMQHQMQRQGMQQQENATWNIFWQRSLNYPFWDWGNQTIQIDYMRDVSYNNPLYESPFKIYPKLTIVTFLIFQIRLVLVFSTSGNLSKKQSLCHGCVMLCQSIFMPYTHNGYTNCQAVIGPSHWLEEKKHKREALNQSGIGYVKPPERFIIIRVFHDFWLDILEVMESFWRQDFHGFSMFCLFI